MPSVVDVANRALSKLGAKRIVSLNEDSRNARSVNSCLEILRDAELSSNDWNFAIKRAQLAPSATVPPFGKAQAFPLPADFLRLSHFDQYWVTLNTDWEIEGQSIATNYGTLINLRYVSRVTDPNTMDFLFIEAWATKMALEMCDEITQSNTKKAALEQDYTLAISKARRNNSFAKRPQTAAEDPWITCRF